MRVKINRKVLKTLENLKDLWLLDHNNRIIVIREFETETVTETPKPKKKFFGKIKTYKPVQNIYLTKLVINGFNTDLKYVGTCDDNYATKLIKWHMHPEGTIDFIEFRKRWLFILEQKDAFFEYNKNQKVTKTDD